MHNCALLLDFVALFWLYGSRVFIFLKMNVLSTKLTHRQWRSDPPIWHCLHFEVICPRKLDHEITFRFVQLYFSLPFLITNHLLSDHLLLLNIQLLPVATLFYYWKPSHVLSYSKLLSYSPINYENWSTSYFELVFTFMWKIFFLLYAASLPPGNKGIISWDKVTIEPLEQRSAVDVVHFFLSTCFSPCMSVKFRIIVSFLFYAV